MRNTPAAATPITTATIPIDRREAAAAIGIVAVVIGVAAASRRSIGVGCGSIPLTASVTSRSPDSSRWSRPTCVAWTNSPSPSASTTSATRSTTTDSRAPDGEHRGVVALAHLRLSDCPSVQIGPGRHDHFREDTAIFPEGEFLLGHGCLRKPSKVGPVEKYPKLRYVPG
jgi:hypothetical protein